MTTALQSSSTKTQILDSSHLFLKSHKSLSQQQRQQNPPPPSLSLLSKHSPLPSIPSDFPLHKLIPKTRFVIDGFRHAGDHSVSYFLSHFHSDHYTGLTPNWCKGIIFCSDTTARLLVEVLKISSLFVVPLPLQERVLIDGCEAILIDANHCPGAVQFLFKIPVSEGKIERYVHTGDFRFCKSMTLEPIISDFVSADAIFLDTTYCNPKFIFPSQEESIDYIVNAIDRIGVENNKSSLKSVLFLVATYVIGKERILLEISRKCNRRIHVDGRKMAVLRVLGYGESGVFTEDESESDVHVVGWSVLGETWPYFRPNFVKMKEIMIERGYSKVVGFVPTGWTYEVKRNKFAVKAKDSFEIHLVPYSEHSNYDELREYVKFLKPKRVIPTVGLDVEKLDSKHANKMKKHFAGLVDEMANKHEFLMGFHRKTKEMDGKVECDARLIPTKGLDQKRNINLTEMKANETTDTQCVLDSPSTQPGSRDSAVLNEEETEELIQELRDCLPTWVTQTQMLGLLSNSGRNIVEAVSNFYERETEFYELVIAHAKSLPTSQTSTPKDPASLPKLNSFKRNPCGNVELPRSQEKAQNKMHSIKSSNSPGKRKKKSDNKPNKKVKINSMESTGSKQPTITRFFSKVATNVSQDGDVAINVSQDGDVATNSKQCSNDKKLLPSDGSKSYSHEIDRFIQIINGSESSRTRAATILEKTKGDINMALDIYYSNPEGDLGENEERLVDCKNSVQPFHNCSSGQEENALEETGPMTSLSVQVISTEKEETGPMIGFSVMGLSKEDVAMTYVTLPPEKYIPIDHACWINGKSAPYIHLARTFDLVEAEKGKIKATSMLCNMFRSLLALSPEDVLPAVYLCTNKIASDHENMELNIGGSLVTAALEEACGANRSKIRELYNNLGDLGDVAQLCRQTQKLLVPPSPLLIKDVFSVLRKISVQTGSGSTLRKKSLIVNLMRSCREKEIKFIVRTLVRNLRIGAMMRTVLPALAQAVVMNSSSKIDHEGTTVNLKERLQCISTAVVEAYNVLPSLDLLVPSLMNKGNGFSSSTLSMVPGIPLKPMLAKITNGIPQALKLFQNKAFTCEYKYDGQRAQIHKLVDGSVRVFSRNGDETTSRFPDLVNIIKESWRTAASTFILDAEVVAVDRKNGCKLMSFQELSSRERGSKDSSIAVDSIKVDICIFVFDIMFANGEQLLSFPFRQRRKYLKDMFNEKSGYFEYAKETTIEVDDALLSSETTLSRVNSFLEDAFNSSCEGIMVKSLDVDAGYSPSKRTDTWLKVKRDYVEGLNDSLDLVPIGAWHGNGRKAGWYSPFLMACYNPDTEEFQSVCRVMSGFSDSFYTEMKEIYSGDKILSRKPPYYKTAEVPDLWFASELVWQIRGADFTVSPVHQAAIGLVHPSRGISVRFPRFIRTVSDRNPEECSTASDIAEMFRSQTRKMDVNV